VAGVLELTGRHAAAAPIMEMRQAALGAHEAPRGAPWALAASVVGIGIAIGALWLATHSGQMLQPVAPIIAVATTSPPTHFATAIGERATISLPDGSTATLDTQSELDVVYSDTERGIRLLRGQALFEVAKRKATPFQVYAGGRRITAVGTVFNVRLDGARIRISLIEGKVRVASQPGSGSAATTSEQVTMSPGQILDSAPAAPMTVTVADASRTTSWRDGVAVFVDTRLADVVAEMNRYTSVQIVVADSVASELHVSGVFKTGDVERFADSVTKVFPLSVDRSSDGVIVLRSVTDQK
jgi:transmembrane sensor